MPNSEGEMQVKRSVGAPRGNTNRLTHGLVAFENEVRRRKRKSRSLIDRRTKAGLNAIAVRNEILADLGGLRT